MAQVKSQDKGNPAAGRSSGGEGKEDPKQH
jgi:hypothetical protein